MQSGGAGTWVIDLGGVIWLAQEEIPGSSQAVARLRGAGVRVLFATNNALPTRAELVGQLAHVGIGAEPDDLVTSAQAAASMLAPGTRSERPWPTGGCPWSPKAPPMPWWWVSPEPSTSTCSPPPSRPYAGAPASWPPTRTSPIPPPAASFPGPERWWRRWPPPPRPHRRWRASPTRPSSPSSPTGPPTSPWWWGTGPPPTGSW